MRILVINAGSSTVKLSLFDANDQKLLASETHETQDASSALDAFLSSFPGQVDLVGHRFVHGGTRFVQPVRITPGVVDELKQLSDLAPLHNPASLRSLDAAWRRFPSAPHVAVFDTAFFSALPKRAYVYPAPYDWYSQWGIRRFGFHGINHEYCAARAGQLAKPRHLIVCHLGSGCSATAIRNGRPIATTMGFTPVEGLMMATRSGSIDPGIVFHLARERRMTFDQIEQALNHESGLLGISGVSADYREVEKAANAGNSRAILAREIFEDRVVSVIGGLAALLGGVDALVFTGGTGEHRADLRSRVCDRLRWMSLELDQLRNQKCTP